MESLYVDWIAAFESDEWKFIGRDVMEKLFGEWSEDNPSGIERDDYIPIYNYAYPLDLYSLEDEKIWRICKETNCTVVRNNTEDRLYLALCGCGMDMSQDIALAYMIAYAWGSDRYGHIPDHMLFDVIKSGAFSVNQEQFDNIRKALIQGFENLKQRCEQEVTELKH